MVTTENSFSAQLRRGLYEAVFRRRDMREFMSDPVPDQILARVLTPAHHAASAGFTQPWDFIVVRDVERRRKVKQIFDEEHAKNAAQFVGERRRKFLSFKLEGILEAPLNVIVTCEPERFGPAVIGRVENHDVEIYSTCLAVENLWLAARAEGLGVGWVSIVRNDDLQRIFSIPVNIVPIAYLCMGYVKAFPERATFQSAGWLDRLPPQRLIHFDDWKSESQEGQRFAKVIASPSIWEEIFPPGQDPIHKDGARSDGRDVP